MTKYEYHRVCKALRCFNSDDDGRWEDGMVILVELRERHERHSLRHLRPEYFGNADKIEADEKGGE